MKLQSKDTLIGGLGGEIERLQGLVGGGVGRGVGEEDLVKIYGDVKVLNERVGELKNENAKLKTAMVA